jgi:hypothetical protein
MEDYLLLFLKPGDDQETGFSQWRKEIFSGRLDINEFLLLDSDDTLGDGKKYRHLNIYRLTDLSSLTGLEIDEYMQTNSAYNYLSTYHWQLYSSIAEVRQSPLSAVTVVTVGITIPTDPESHQKLDEWYTQEHIPSLAAVPGWQAGIRLQLTDRSGKDAEYATPYLAIHEWAEPNGLGGDIWKKAVFTPWSERIMKLQTAPVHRRVWRCV